MRRFEIALPGSVDDCLQILSGHGADAKLVAGGSDLLPQLKNGLLKPGWVVDLSGVSRLRTLEVDAGKGLRVGAAVTARELELHSGVRAGYLALAESGALVGSVQVRNLATIGGTCVTPRPRPIWSRRCSLSMPKRSSRARRGSAGFRSRRSSWGSVGPCSARTSCCSRSWRRRPGHEAVGTICVTRLGANSTSPLSASPPSSPCRTECAGRRASRWRRWRPYPCGRRQPSRLLKDSR